eukprot:gene945-9852_t
MLTSPKPKKLDNHDTVVETPKIKRQLFPDQTPARQLLQPQNKTEKISVYLRLKPLDSNEMRAISKHDDNTAEIVTQARVGVGKERYEPKGDKYYFDHVFDESIDQNTIFKKTTLPLLTSFFEGISGLVFSYGVTNAGKTYTVLGSPTNPGIIPKTLSVAFSMLKTLNETEELKYHLEVTYVEVYNDNVYDLLVDQKSIKEKLPLVDQNGSIIVKGANNVKINSTKDASDLLTFGSKNRSIAQTSLNRDSSRSHTVFTIKLIKEGAKKDESFSQFAIVDLAGSERKHRTHAQGDRLKEAININQSLTTLGRCLNILKLNQISKNPQIVPYRDSKLTRMFQDLIQEGKVAMIVNASPSENDVEENTFVLKYAAVASKINTGSKLDTKIERKTTKATPFNLQTSVAKTPRSTRPQVTQAEYQLQNDLTVELKIRQNVTNELEPVIKELEDSFLQNLEQTNSIYEKKYENKIKMLRQTYENIIAQLKNNSENVTPNKNNSNSEKVGELKEICKNLRDEISNERDEHKDMTNQLQAEIYEDKHQIQELKNELENCKAELGDCKEEIKNYDLKYQNERQAWSKQTNNLQIEFEKIENQYNDSINQLNKELSRSRENSKKDKEEIEELREQLAEAAKKLGEKSGLGDKFKQLFTKKKDVEPTKSKSQPNLTYKEEEDDDDEEEEEVKPKTKKRGLNGKKTSESKKKKYDSYDDIKVVVPEADVFDYDPSPEQKPTTKRVTRSRAKINYEEQEYVDEKPKKTVTRTRKLIKKKK